MLHIEEYFCCFLLTSCKVLECYFGDAWFSDGREGGYSLDVYCQSTLVPRCFFVAHSRGGIAVWMGYRQREMYSFNAVFLPLIQLT